MVYNISYEVSALIILLVFFAATTINYPTINEKNRHYIRLTVLVFVTEFFDIFTAVIISYKDVFPRIVNLLGNEAYFMFGIAMLYMLSSYIDEYIIPDGGISLLHKPGKIILVASEIVIFFNIFGGYLFYVTEENVYTHNTFFYFPHIISFVYIILIGLTIAINVKVLSKGEIVYGFSITLAYIIPTLVQVFFMPDTLLVMFGGSLIMIMTFFLLESPDYVELQETLEALDVAKEEAIQANNAKGHFLANMSHEIRTPINAVLGMNTMILRKSKDPEIRKYAGDIQSAGRSLLSIINDILDFSKIESGKMELVPVDYDFSSLVNDVYNMISTKARDKDLELVLDIDETIPARLYGDDVRIRQILVNLLTNAVKYTPSGKVSLSIRRNEEVASAVGPEATVEPAEKNCSLHFAVKDTGIGIKPEDINKLTEEFVRIEESRNRNIEGTGLGINIVVSLLALMGSKLEIESVYGEGSTFYFDISQPITLQDAIGNISERINNDYTEEEDYLASFCIPDARVLVVDDNPMNLSVFSSLLSDMLCRIDEADSGAKCLELVKENKYDIIFMDHMMPEMDGIETFHHMQELAQTSGQEAGRNVGQPAAGYQNADTPVIILTANAISGAKESYLSEGFTDYMSKPIDADKLEAMIGKLIPEEKKQAVKKSGAEAEPGVEGATRATGTEADTELPFIDGVDWKHALAKLKKESLLLDSVKNFSNMARADFKILTEMYERLETSVAHAGMEQQAGAEQQAAFDEYRVKVHAMKSNVATIGADHVAGLAKYLEYAARDYDMDTIRNLMPLFGSEWNRLSTEIDEAFGYHRKETDDMDDRNPIDIGELELLLEALREAMEESDLDRADAVVEELSEYSYPKDQSELLEELKIAVLNIDAEKVENVAREWNSLIKQ